MMFDRVVIGAWIRADGEAGVNPRPSDAAVSRQAETSFSAFAVARFRTERSGLAATRSQNSEPPERVRMAVTFNADYPGPRSMIDEINITTKRRRVDTSLSAIMPAARDLYFSDNALRSNSILGEVCRIFSRNGDFFIPRCQVPFPAVKDE